LSKYLAIDLDPSGLYVVAGTARGGSVKIEQALSWSADSDGGPPPLSAETAKAVGEQLRDRLKGAAIAPAPVLVSVSRDRVILKEIRHPAVKPTEEPALVRFQALKEITESPDDVVIDYVPLSGAAPDGEKRALAVVLRRDVYSAIQAMCTAAGLKLAGVTPRPFAVAAGLTRAFASAAAPPPDNTEESLGVLTVGPAGGEFVVVRHAEVLFTRAVPAPVASSETLLVGEIRRNLAVYAGQDPAHPVKSVYVAESGPLGWTARLRTGIGVPVHAYDPLDTAVPELTGVVRGRFVGAAGLLAAKANDTLPINFASPRQPRVAAHPMKQKMMLAALVAMLLIAAGGLFGWMQLEAADEKIANLQTRKAQLEQSVTQLEPKEKQYKAIEQWQTREVVWLDELYDLADRFPSIDKLRLTQFAGTAIQPDKNGKQDAQARLELKLATTQAEAVDALVTAIERDNQNKKFFYLGTQKIVQQDVFTILTKVNRRQPNEYTRHPTFSVPNRRVFSFSTPPPKEDTTPKEDPKDDQPPIVFDPDMN
jgi:hypothetical protein